MTMTSVLKPTKVGCDLGEAFAASLPPSIFNRDGASLYPSEFARPLQKRGQPPAFDHGSALPQEPDGR